MRRLGIVLLAGTACQSAPSPPRIPSLGDTAAYREARQLVSSGRFAPGAVSFARVRDSFAAQGDSTNAWYGQLWWAETMTRAGQRDSANSGLARARHLAGTDPRKLGWVLVMESHAFERRGRLDSAIASAEQAIEAYRRTGDRELGVFGYDALGTPLSRRGRYRDALAADSTSLALRLAIPMGQRVIASGWNEVAIGYRHLARFDEAEMALRNSYRLAEAAHDTLAMALALANLSNVLNDTGDRAGAIARLIEAGRAVEAIGHRRFINEFDNDLAGLYLEAGRAELAAAPAERALIGGRAMDNRAIEITALEALGRVELERRQLAAARDTLSRGVALADQYGFGAERVSGRVGLVDVAIATNQPDQARRIAEAAVRIADSLGDPAIQFTALEARARSLEASRKPEAGPAFDAALDLLESVRGRLALGDLRMGIAAPRIAAYEAAIRTRLARGEVLEAFHVAERARGRMLLQLIADRGLRYGGTPLDSLRQRLREAFDGRSNSRDPGAITRFDREVVALTDSLHRLESRDPLASGQPLPLELVRSTLLGGERALLAWFWGERQVIGWWVTSHEVRAVTLGHPDSLAASIELLAGALERPSDDTLWWGPARILHRRLITPLTATLPAELILVPDGPLHRIPLELILREDKALPRVSYAPSASVLTTLAGREKGDWEKEILVVGNPRASGGLGSLPFAEQEARTVQELFRDRGADALIGKSATIPRWLSFTPGRYRFLHFALHARANGRDPEQTALFFTDGSLRLSAIRQLRLSAELVSLSACETAVGPWVRGEGVIGLPYAFLAAGARGALVTFWRVPDQVAAEFSEAFYREVRAGRAPAEALSRVKAAWRSGGGERAHPSRWAAFIFVGWSA